MDNDKIIKNVFKYLDTIDLNIYLNQYKNESISTLMFELQKIFKYKDKYSECLF